MFFSIFWTAYIPVWMIILSLAGEWLMHSFRRLRVRAGIASSNVPAQLTKQLEHSKGSPERRPREPRYERLMHNWR